MTALFQRLARLQGAIGSLAPEMEQTVPLAALETRADLEWVLAQLRGERDALGADLTDARLRRRAVQAYAATKKIWK